MIPRAGNQNLPPSETQSEGASPANPAPNPASESVNHDEKTEPENPVSRQPAEQGVASAYPASVTIGPKATSPEKAPELRVPPILFEGDEPAPTPPATESAAKFAIGAAPAPVAPEKMTLPEAYGTGQLWVTSRDPHCLYARWDLTSEQQKHCRALAKDHQLFLRVHLDGLRNRGILELKVSPEPRHSFIQVPLAGRGYLVELGYYAADLRWNPLAVAQEVRTPPESMAQEKTVRFASVPARSPIAQEPTAAISNSPHAEVPQPKTAAAQPVLASTEGASIQTTTTESAPKPGYERIDSFAHEVPQQSFEATWAPVSDWTPAQEEALADIIDWNMPRVESPSSAEMVQPEQIPVDISFPGGISSLAPQEEISSPLGGEVPQQKGFWLSINAELVIYGAAHPGARITIGGHPIRLRPDGTFSYRFALPDGHYELPIAATSAEGDLRRADLEFSRSTTYQGEVQPHPQDPTLKKPGAGNVRPD